jgi:Protein of unknown function (DUF3567)
MKARRHLEKASFHPNVRNVRRLRAIYSANDGMQIVYDSQHYHVIEYSAFGGYELTNKGAHVCAYFHGLAAAAFRDNFARVIAQNPSIDAVDEYLGGFDSLLTLPVVLH